MGKISHIPLPFICFFAELPAPECPVRGQRILPAIVLCLVGIREADAEQGALNCKKLSPFTRSVFHSPPPWETLPAEGSS